MHDQSGDEIRGRVIFVDASMSLQRHRCTVQAQVCRSLLFPLQVHYSTHLAVTQALRRSQQQQQKHLHWEESKQLALFGNLLKDRNGNLHSPYAPSILDI